MHSLTLLYDFGETKVQQRNFIAKGNKRKHRFLQVRPDSSSYFAIFALSLHKIGCTSAIEASFIALGLHYLCKTHAQNIDKT